MRHSSDRSNRPARRTEPTLGDLKPMSAAGEPTSPARRRSAKPAPRRGGRRYGWIAVLLVVLVAGAWAWSERATLRALLPHTQLTELLERANKAFAAGKLDGNDGTSARELFTAARALAPDDGRPLAGLQKVGKAEFQRATEAFKAGDLDSAGRNLDQARALLGGGSELDQLAAKIAATRARGTQLDSLLASARKAEAGGRPASAAALYRQMLTADPGNAVARHGLDKLGARLAAAARTAIAAGKLVDAQQAVDQLAELVPDYSGLAGLRAALTQATAKAAATRDAMLQQAAADLAAGRIAGVGGDNALARYRAVLAADPDNQAAHAGLKQVASALLKQADAAIDAGKLDRAASALKTATTLDPASVALADARARLAAARKTPADAASTAAPVVSAADRAKAQSLIARAAAAADSGALMLPPGNCAYDLYRSALALDPGNGDALAGLASLPSTAERLFDAAIAAAKPGEAAKRMAAFSRLAPGSSRLPALRAKLAGAWIARASHSADMGKLAEARRALGEARKLAPGDARIAALAHRLGG